MPYRLMWVPEETAEVLARWTAEDLAQCLREMTELDSWKLRRELLEEDLALAYQRLREAQSMEDVVKVQAAIEACERELEIPALVRAYAKEMADGRHRPE